MKYINRILAIINVVLAQMTGAVMAGCVWLGYQYMYGTGYGLHPGLAGALFMAALSVPWLLLEFPEPEYDEEEILVRIERSFNSYGEDE
jgi:hypothetical protein